MLIDKIYLTVLLCVKWHCKQILYKENFLKKIIANAPLFLLWQKSAALPNFAFIFIFKISLAFFSAMNMKLHNKKQTETTGRQQWEPSLTSPPAVI